MLLCTGLLEFLEVKKEEQRCVALYIQRDCLKQHFRYLKEEHGGRRLNGAIVDHILVSQVFKGLDGDVFVVGGEHGAEVAKVASQQHDSKEPPHSTDHAAGQGLRVRASPWNDTDRVSLLSRVNLWEEQSE